MSCPAHELAVSRPFLTAMDTKSEIQNLGIGEHRTLNEMKYVRSKLGTFIEEAQTGRRNKGHDQERKFK